MVMTDDCCAFMSEALPGITPVFFLVDKEKVLQSIGWIYMRAYEVFSIFSMYFVLGLKWNLFSLHCPNLALGVISSRQNNVSHNHFPT